MYIYYRSCSAMPLCVQIIQWSSFRLGTVRANEAMTQLIICPLDVDRTSETRETNHALRSKYITSFVSGQDYFPVLQRRCRLFPRILIQDRTIRGVCLSRIHKRGPLPLLYPFPPTPFYSLPTLRFHPFP